MPPNSSSSTMTKRRGPTDRATSPPTAPLEHRHVARLGQDRRPRARCQPRQLARRPHHHRQSASRCSATAAVHLHRRRDRQILVPHVADDADDRAQGPRGSPIFTCRPIGSSPGQTARAVCSPISRTFSPPARSPSVKSRPAQEGDAHHGKILGRHGVTLDVGILGSGRPALDVKAPRVTVAAGESARAAAASTPGSARSRATIASIFASTTSSFV
jgi:hypothetical protein